MSKIVSPYPPHIRQDYSPPPGAAWWRFRLRPNADGRTMLMETDARGSVITWCSWEFFDGENVIIDTGFDHPVPVVVDYTRGGFIDVLHVGPPTPSPFWEQLPTAAWPHPEDDLGF